MDNYKEIASRICVALIGYYISHDARRILIETEAADPGVIVRMSGEMPVKPADLEGLTKALHAERSLETDVYYSGLLGSASDSDDFRLLGALSDEAEVSFDNGKLNIFVTRHQRF